MFEQERKKERKKRNHSAEGTAKLEDIYD